MSEKKEAKVVDLRKRVEVVATKTFPLRKEGDKFKVSAHLVDNLKAKGFIK